MYQTIADYTIKVMLKSMKEATLATNETKTALENVVTWYLNDKLSVPGVTIATQKFLTHDNRLIYLTRCAIAEQMIPRIKVQVLERVKGGVHETGYQLYDDHRLERYQNAMIFGEGLSAPDAAAEPVEEAEAAELVALVTALQSNARALV